MSDSDFDVIVVGARCAGAPTALLLARRGYRVLLLDRATFPSDTLSSHVLHPQGAAALARWSLLERLVASGCPPIHRYAFHFGPLAISGSPVSAGEPPAYCPRRTVLDQLLVNAAVEAGAELRESFSVEELRFSDGHVCGIRGHGKAGPSVAVSAPLVVGADGRHSLVAKAVSAEVYHERPMLQAGYYAYWSGLPTGGCFETYIGDRRGFAAAETHEGLTMVVGGWPFAEFATNRHDHERHYLALFDQAPAFRERLQGARRESKVLGGATPNFFRKPFGPGWALVGDAGYIKDPITAQGIVNAFRDAELLADAIDAWRAHGQPYETALSKYQSERDRQSLPMYDFTCQLARLEAPPSDLVQLLAAVQGNQDAMDQFCRLNAGALSPAEFFAEANVGRIFEAARGRPPGFPRSGSGQRAV